MRRHSLFTILTLLFFISLSTTIYGQDFSKIDGVISSKQKFSVGSSWVDINNDGYQDLYVTNNLNSNNSLYINNGDGTFSQDTSRIIAKDSKRGSSSGWIDFDNDGDMDLFVSNARQTNDIYINQGDGSFADDNSLIIAQDIETSIASSWGDYNNDGYIDLFVGNGFNSLQNSLYKNNGDGTFSKITSGPIGERYADTRSAAWGDMDNDGDLDLFVGNVNGQTDDLYENMGDGTFNKVKSGPIVETEMTSPSATWIDYDNDRDMDLFVADGNQKILYENKGDGNFVRIEEGILVEDTQSVSGHCWADFNNDGWLDVVVGSGYGSTGGPKNLYMGTGEGQFRKVTNGIIVNDTSISRGVSCSDINNDGYIDVFVANGHYQSNSLYKNELTGNNWFAATLKGQETNYAAIGSKVKKLADLGNGKVWQTRTVTSQTGHRSQNSLQVHFGLANARQIDSLVVEWPSGLRQVHTDVDVNQHMNITEGSFVKELTLKVGKAGAVPGDTARVPVYLNVPTDSSYSSFEFSFDIVSTIEFAGLDTSNSLLADRGWMISTNRQDSLLHISSAGSQNIRQKGLLFTLQMKVPETATGSYPIRLPEVLFNTDAHPSEIDHGVVIIPDYGDIDYNRKVQAFDASLILQNVLEKKIFTDAQKHYADVSLDGNITALDASLILQYTTDAITDLPVEEDQERFAASGSVVMNDAEEGQDGTVEVPVLVREAENIYAYKGQLTYDDSKLQYKGIKESRNTQEGIEASKEKSTIRFASAQSNPIEEEGELVNIVFEVRNNSKDEDPQVVLSKLRLNEEQTMNEVAQSLIYTSTGIAGGESETPNRVQLQQNYPNPFNPTTTIQYSLPEASKVQLTVYNVIGQKVRNLVNEHKQAGSHSVQFHASNLPSGVYSYTIHTAGIKKSRKMLLVK